MAIDREPLGTDHEHNLSLIANFAKMRTFGLISVIRKL